MKNRSTNKTGDQLNSGPKHQVVWIHDESWKAGFKAGEAGTPSSPVPEGIDGLSWFSGWIARARQNG